MATGPQRFLRVEGAAIGLTALAAFFTLKGSIVLLIVLALAPDISMLGYLRGPRFGSTVYNLAHTYALPLALGGIGFWIEELLVMQVASIWIGHIGFDRLMGYGPSVLV